MTGVHRLAGVLAINADKVNAGWIAGVVILFLVIGTFLLWRNMNKQLGRIKAPYRDEVEPGRPRRPRPGRGLNAPRPPVEDEPRRLRAEEITDRGDYPDEDESEGRPPEGTS